MEARVNCQPRTGALHVVFGLVGAMCYLAYAVAYAASSSAQPPYRPGDETAIQASLMAGEYVELSAGEFRFETGWRLTEPAQIVGAGRERTVLLFEHPASDGGAAIEWVGAGELALMDVGVRLEKGSPPADVILVAAGVLNLQRVEVSGGVANPAGRNVQGAGLRFLEVSEGLIRDSVVHGNGGMGLIASNDAVLHVERTEFKNNGGGGAHLMDSASVALVDSAVRANSNAGVVVDGWAWFTSLRSEFSHNRGNGVEVVAYSESMIIESILAHNLGVGFAARDHAWSSLVGNEIIWNGSVGVSVGYSSRVALLENEVAANAHHGLFAAENALVSVLGNTIRENGGSGVILAGTAGGSITGNLIEGNKGNGVACEDRARAVVDHNDMHDNALYGFVQDDTSLCSERPSTATEHDLDDRP